MSGIYVTTKAKHINYKEGDVWSENGKDWTIKSGLKRTVSKMDASRKMVFTPLACPVCNNAMKHPLDEKMWNYNGKCFSCTIDMEHEIMKAGNWKEYERGRLTANADAFCEDMETTLNEYIQDSVANTNVSENGLLEKWKDANPVFLKSVVDKEVSELKEKIKKYKNI